MSYQFEGRSFATLSAWEREFPAYRSYPDLLRAGADTIQKMETAIAARARNHRKQSIAGSIKGRKTNPHIVLSRKRNLCP